MLINKRKKPLQVFLQLTSLQHKAFKRGMKPLAKRLGIKLKEFKQDHPLFVNY